MMDSSHDNEYNDITTTVVLLNSEVVMIAKLQEVFLSFLMLALQLHILL